MTPAEIREELARRAAGIVPRPAHYIEDVEAPFRDAEDFCESCALAAAGALEVRREYNSDSDVLRWCSACGALLGYRIGPGGAEEEIQRWEEKPPRAASDWAELLHAMAEVEPADFREPGDPPVELSPLWGRVAALLTPRTPCAVSRELRPCEAPATCAACGKKAARPWRPGDAPTWRRGPSGWLLVPGGGEVCSQICLDRVAAHGQKLAAALFGMAAASGVDLEPPPRSRPC